MLAEHGPTQLGTCFDFELWLVSNANTLMTYLEFFLTQCWLPVHNVVLPRNSTNGEILDF